LDLARAASLNGRASSEALAALADDAYIAHISAGGQTARIAELLALWAVAIR
jgi:hypothetical protein